MSTVYTTIETLGGPEKSGALDHGTNHLASTHGTNDDNHSKLGTCAETVCN
jgi:hypothetical protein